MVGRGVRLLRCGAHAEAFPPPQMIGGPVSGRGQRRAVTASVDHRWTNTNMATPTPTITMATAMPSTGHNAGRDRLRRLARLGRDVSTIIVTEP